MKESRTTLPPPKAVTAGGGRGVFALCGGARDSVGRPSGLVAGSVAPGRGQRRGTAGLRRGRHRLRHADQAGSDQVLVAKLKQALEKRAATPLAATLWALLAEMCGAPRLRAVARVARPASRGRFAIGASGMKSAKYRLVSNRNGGQRDVGTPTAAKKTGMPYSEFQTVNSRSNANFRAPEVGDLRHQPKSVFEGMTVSQRRLKIRAKYVR